MTNELESQQVRISKPGPLVSGALSNSRKNEGRAPRGMRYNDVSLRCLAKVICLIQGRVGYDIVLGGAGTDALPQFGTIQKQLRLESPSVVEGEWLVRSFWEFVRDSVTTDRKHLVVIAEDATGITAKLIHDAVITGRVIGAISGSHGEQQLRENGFPDYSSNVPATLEDVDRICGQRKCNLVYAYVARLVGSGKPGQAIGLMGTCNEYTANEVLRRWMAMTRRLVKESELL